MTVLCNLYVYIEWYKNKKYALKFKKVCIGYWQVKKRKKQNVLEQKLTKEHIYYSENKKFTYAFSLNFWFIETIKIL